MTAQEAGRIALDVLIAFAERGRAAEPPLRRNREIPGWLDCLDAARRTWPWVTAEAWDASGELPAREGRHFVASQNELAMEVGLLGLDDPPWSKRPSGR